jgi:hypothetical protein
MLTTTKIYARNNGDKVTGSNAFRGEGTVWYNIGPTAKAEYDQTAKLDTVEVDFEKINGRNIVTAIRKVASAPVVAAPVTTPTPAPVAAPVVAPAAVTPVPAHVVAPVATVTAPKPVVVTPVVAPAPVVKDEPAPAKKNSGGYGFGSPADILGKTIGCSVNSAAAILSNPSIELTDNTPAGFVAAAKFIADALTQYMLDKQ